MTVTALRPELDNQPAPSRRWLWLRSHWASLAVLTPLLVLAGLWQYIGMAGAPQRIDDEGTYVAQAYAVQTFHSLGHYTYWYDHPPLGWIQLAAYTWPTNAFGREPNAVLAGREAMLFFQLISCVLLWTLCRRLLMARWASGLAVVLFALSPLAVQFHRTVYLDNIATPWILASLVLALTPQRRLWAYAASGLCFAVAVLTKETSLLLLPAVGYQLWRSTGAAGTRRYAMSLATSVFALAGTFYVLYAVIKAELLPGSNHVSLVNGIKFQLFSREGSGSIFSAGTLSYAHLHQWLQLDTVFPMLSVLCLVPALFVSRLRPIGVGYLVLLLTMLRPGYLPVPYVIAMLPLAAVVIAGVADSAATWVPARFKTRASDRRRFAPLLPVVVVAALIAGILGAPDWISQQRGLFIGPLDRPVAQAETWIERNVPHSARMTVDDAFWVDLVRAGFPRDNVVWYYKVDTDPAVEKISPQGWRNYDYVVSTQSLRSNPEAAPQVATALANSVPYAVFGTGPTRVEVRRVMPAGLAGYRSAAAASAPARRAAGDELLRNTALSASTPARAVLARGALDLRADVALVTLAATRPVTLSGLPADAGEIAADRPVRTVELRGLTVPQVRSQLSGSQVGYQPESVTATPTGVRLVWSLDGVSVLPGS